jgi:hypothetical protein
MVYEAPNPDLWARAPDEVAAAGLGAFRRQLDAARAADPPIA